MVNEIDSTNMKTNNNSLTAQERANKKARIKELTAIIHQLLIHDPRYRDSDALLVNRVQRDELIGMGLDVNTMSLTDFFRIRYDKKISSEDSITRLRREVQEYYPETRGDKYKKRQSKQSDVQEDLHDVENEIMANKRIEPYTITIKNSSNPIPAQIFNSSNPDECCDYCQGSGKYESFECTACNGTGYVMFK